MILSEYGIDADTLTDDECSKLYACYLRKKEVELEEQENVIYNSVAKLINDALGNGKQDNTMDS